jgi:hypothetical protein
MLTGVALIPAAHATTFTFTCSSTSNCNAGPFGTVSVVQGADANTVNVTETLAAGEVFANTGAGSALSYTLDKTATVVANSLSAGFTASGANNASPFGNFGYTIVCSSCGSGTSSPQYTGPVTFSLYSATGLTAADFIVSSKGYYFAADIGLPDGTRFTTGNVASKTADPTTTPEPGTWVMLLSGFAFTGLGLRKRFTGAQVKA